ncbi:D-alanyl-D-alanine carboxypeptidase/D-alanyl-D-alanine-endopeptidase [Parabacteroides sp. OttesenSCG-928-N08]|nr:D-alanyl-D-alanine carboxypeptidase/D-alanyl-D-alanine-endopeptidase [Parabacteroides sp. OttesenSCG-928-N08]
MRKLIFHTLFFSLFLFSLPASSQSSVVPQPIKQLMAADYMRGITFSMKATNIRTGEVHYAFDADRMVTPASVLKLVTTITALELLGDDYCFPTTLEYDGEIRDGVLYGNLYIRGSGDPSLGSSHIVADRANYRADKNRFIPQWIAAVEKAGIQRISGAVIADDLLFDEEGLSPKWSAEDLGSYYGAGSYGLSVFDNLYTLYLRTGEVGSRPELLDSDPDVSSIRFHNRLTVTQVATDSSYIVGAPYINERRLYGVVPPHKARYPLRGDIPNPPLFLAEWVTKAFARHGIICDKAATSCRLLQEEGEWKAAPRNELVTTYSPPLRELVRITNGVSHNLYADALLKRIGLFYQPKGNEQLSSFNRGIRVLESHWRQKGMDVSRLLMYDGSGLASADKLTAAFLVDLLCHIHQSSPEREAFGQSLPKAGQEGSVRNFLRGTKLEGKARLKSGGMSGVRSYAGYISYEGEVYAVALFANNYRCTSGTITRALEKMLLNLFP